MAQGKHSLCQQFNREALSSSRALALALDYCLDRLRGPWREKGKEYNLCLEGFLLHYRNLIEFFASHGANLRADNPEEWSPRSLSWAELDSIQNVDLYHYDRDISQYLSHSDKNRAEGAIHWKPVEMYKEIEPLLENFRTLFPSVPRLAVPMLGSTDTSTTSVSILSPAIFDSEFIDTL